MSALALQYRDEFIRGIEDGKNLAQTIRALGLTISRQAVSKVLSSDIAYQEAKEDWHEARITNAEQMIVAAREQVDVARARAYWQSVTWRAEREFPQRWGAKQQIEMTVAPVINFVMAPVDNSRVIDNGAVHSLENNENGS